jgi:hypothetical protein
MVGLHRGASIPTGQSSENYQSLFTFNARPESDPSMKTLSLPIMIAASITLVCGVSFAQENTAATNLEAAKELSAASGRPIFAIAGRKT